MESDYSQSGEFVKGLVTRYKKLKGDRKRVEQQWQDIETYVVPFRGEFSEDMTDENQHNWERPEIYDSTAIHAATSLASAVVDSLVNPNSRWFSAEFQAPEMNDEQIAVEWIEESVKRVYQAIQESDFNLEIQETLLDDVGFGTAVMMEREVGTDTWEGVDFEAIPLKSAFFECDHKGQVQYLFRRYMWTPVQAYSYFGEDTPADIIEQAQGSSKVDIKEEYALCIYPRPENKNAETGRQLAPKLRPWGECWVRITGCQQIGEESGYYERPMYVTRWSKTTESKHGNSPAFVAMPAIKTLNKLRQLDLRAREKVVDPALLTTERGLLGDIDLQPSGLTVLRSIDDLKAFESGANFMATENTIERLQADIRQMFFVDQLLLPPMQGNPATATEIQARLQQVWRLLGTAVSRIQKELLDPIIERTFSMMFRAGQLPEMPDVMREGNSKMDIVYLGILARNQKSEQADQIVQFLMTAAELGEAYPAGLKGIDDDMAFRLIRAAKGLPAKIQLTRDEVEQLMADEQAMQAQAEGLAMAQAEGEAMQAQGVGQQAIAGGASGNI